MLIHPAAKEYARAMLDLATEHSAVDSVMNEMADVVGACRDSADLGKIFYHPRVPMQAKREMVQTIFGPSLTGFVLHFLLLLVDKRRETLLPSILEEYGRLVDKARKICKAELTTAMPLAENHKQALVKKLSELTGQAVELSVSVDARIIGGAVLTVGDRRVDGSVLSQLAQLKEAMMNNQATGIGVTG